MDDRDDDVFLIAIRAKGTSDIAPYWSGGEGGYIYYLDPARPGSRAHFQWR
jgi:hypothetical protein